MNKHNVRQSKTIDLLDGSTRVLLPLTIKKLREVINLVKEGLDPVSDIDRISQILVVIFSTIDPSLASDIDTLEDLIDIATFNDILSFVTGAESSREDSGEGVKFEDIPFSEIEARVMIEGHGPWKNFDQIEEDLILDELLLLNDMIIKSKNEHFKMLAVLQGADPDEVYADDEEDSDEELPPEVAEFEREYQRRKKEHFEKHGQKDPGEAGADLAGLGLGYSRK